MADLPDLIAQLRAAAEDLADPFAWFEAASRSNITRILGAYAEMERVLRDYAVSEIYGARARAALQQKDKADE